MEQEVGKEIIIKMRDVCEIQVLVIAFPWRLKLIKSVRTSASDGTLFQENPREGYSFRKSFLGHSHWSSFFLNIEKQVNKRYHDEIMGSKQFLAVRNTISVLFFKLINTCSGGKTPQAKIVTEER